MKGLYMGVAQDRLGVNVCRWNDAGELEWKYLPGETLPEPQKGEAVRKIVLAVEKPPEEPRCIFPGLAETVQTVEDWWKAAAQCAVCRMQEAGRADGNIFVLLLEERPAFALYHMEAPGGLRELARGQAGKDAGFGAWEASVGLPGIAAAWREDCGNASAAMRNYYRSNGRQDGTVFPELLCSQADAAFQSTCAPELDALLEQAEAVLDGQGAGEDLPEIVLIGTFADFYPAEHLVRAHFCFDPFLPEPCFVPVPKGRPHNYLIAQGAALLASGKTGGAECWEEETSVLLLKRQEAGVGKETVPLILPGQPLKDLTEPVHAVTAYLAPGEPVSFLVGGETVEVPTPKRLCPAGAPGQMVEIGACVREGKLCAALRTRGGQWELIPAKAKGRGDKP